MNNRIEVFRQMLADDPQNTLVMFGLAKEYEKIGDFRAVIEMLEDYLSRADDEGNAYGSLANAYKQTGDIEKAREALEKGIGVSRAHGHPTMASDYEFTLSMLDE